MITDKTISKLKSTLDATQQVAIFGHAHPDGDCLGACLAIGAICEKLGSTVRYITPDFPSSQFDFLDKIDQFDIRFPYPEQIDTCIFLDTADRSRSGPYRANNPTYFDQRQTVLVDHHLSNTGFADLNLIDPQASSTCELLTELFDELYPELLDAQIASYLLMGISTDTGNFIYENNPPRTFAATLKLLTVGADKQTMIDHLYRSVPFSTFQFLGELTARTQQTDLVVRSRYDRSELDRRGISPEGLSDYFVFQLQGIDHSGAFILFKADEHDTPPSIKCSIRTKNPQLNVAELAQTFGGGGHQFAAGAKISGYTNLQHTLTATVQQCNQLLHQQLDS